MNLVIANYIRSAVLLVIALPVSVGVLLSAQKPPEDKSTVIKADLRAELTEPCLQWAVSKSDSKLEREAKNDIEEVLGGEVSHAEACKWVLS